MKKRLAVVSYHAYSVEIYRTILTSLFGSSIDIETYAFDDRSIHQGISSDLILLSSATLFQEVKDYVLDDCEIIIANYTLMIRDLEKTQALPEGTRALLVNINHKVCMETIAFFYQYGMTNLELIPYYPGVAPQPDVHLAITPGESRLVPEMVETVIDVGHRVLDINTVVDIATKLSIDDVLKRGRFKTYFSEVVPLNFGLEKLLGEKDNLDSQMDVLLSILDEGVIIADANGTIFSFNKSASTILGKNGEALIGRNVVNQLSELPFHEAFSTGGTVRDRLIKVNDSDIVVTITPIVKSGVLRCAIARVKAFTAIEKKQHELRARLIGKGHRARYTFADIRGHSKEILNCCKIARRMANSSSSILITGESGTGKELFAQAIHNESYRKDYQFVAVNCAALPENLLESELFGYEGGAFTGAKKEGKTGLFELAHNGTLFLDEIGEISPKLQARLLRVLQERTVMRIGGDTVINVNVRVIAATNRDLQELIGENKFRQDLYYRLNVLPLKVPALRERREDILELVDWYSREFKADFNLAECAASALVEHDWDGNIRELKNYVEYLANLGSPVVQAADLPFDRRRESHVPRALVAAAVPDRLERTLEPDGRLDPRYALEEYLFVLKDLQRCFIQRERAGRRSISARSGEESIFLSEQEVRGILLELQRIECVVVNKGRGGTKITDQGRQLLAKMEQKV